MLPEPRKKFPFTPSALRKLSNLTCSVSTHCFSNGIPKINAGKHPTRAIITVKTTMPITPKNHGKNPSHQSCINLIAEIRPIIPNVIIQSILFFSFFLIRIVNRIQYVADNFISDNALFVNILHNLKQNTLRLWSEGVLSFAELALRRLYLRKPSGALGLLDLQVYAGIILDAHDAEKGTNGLCRRTLAADYLGHV